MDVLAKFEAIARNYLKLVFERYHTSHRTYDDVATYTVLTKAANELTTRQFDFVEEYFIFGKTINQMAVKHNTTLYDARKELQCGVLKLIERLKPEQYRDLMFMKDLNRVIRNLPD